MEIRRPLSLKSMASETPSDATEIEALRRKGFLSPDPTFSIRLSDARLEARERAFLLGIGNRIWGK